MNRLPLYLLYFFLTVVLCALSFRESLLNAPQQTSPNRSAGDVQRGKYLVEEVAKCAECHTPRDTSGNLKSNSWLQGAPIWIQPVAPIQNWDDQAPALAGLPSFTDGQMERVLETGVGPQGETLRPPMHTYHMHQDDARAIIAYLKTLTPEQR